MLSFLHRRAQARACLLIVNTYTLQCWIVCLVSSEWIFGLHQLMRVVQPSPDNRMTRLSFCRISLVHGRHWSSQWTHHSRTRYRLPDQCGKNASMQKHVFYVLFVRNIAWSAFVTLTAMLLADANSSRSGHWHTLYKLYFFLLQNNVGARTWVSHSHLIERHDSASITVRNFPTRAKFVWKREFGILL